MSRWSTLAGVAAVSLLPAGFLAGRATAPGAITPGGFEFTLETRVPVPPEEAFDAFTGDVSGWWDHHMSEHPVSLVIDPFPGGHFQETFDAAGNGVIHADVTYAHRGHKLVLRGPLGLHGYAVDGVWVLDFTADGDGTKVAFTGRVVGQVQEGWDTLVAQVWQHFLVEQYTPWVTAGHHR